MAQGKNVNRKEALHGFNSDPVAAAAHIYSGSMVCLDASGNAIEPGVATGLIVRGVADHEADNSAGAAGAIRVRSKRGTFGFTNSASTDTITRAEIGDDVYIVDGTTVAKTSATNTRSVAGKCVFIEDGLVYVTVGLQFGESN